MNIMFNIDKKYMKVYTGGVVMNNKKGKEGRESKETKNKCERVCNSNVGVSEKMLREQFLDERILGLKELRDNISSVFETVVKSYRDVLVGNAKKGGETVSIIATELLTELLEPYKFNTVVQFDEATKQYEVIIDEINAAGSGETKEEAIEVTIDNVLALTEDYFDDIDLYMRIESQRRYYPYFMKIKHCKDREELIRVLNLQ